MNLHQLSNKPSQNFNAQLNRPSTMLLPSNTHSTVNVAQESIEQQTNKENNTIAYPSFIAAQHAIKGLYRNNGHHEDYFNVTSEKLKSLNTDNSRVSSHAFPPRQSINSKQSIMNTFRTSSKPNHLFVDPTQISSPSTSKNPVFLKDISNTYDTKRNPQQSKSDEGASIEVREHHLEWQMQYRRAFPYFHFYFDQVDSSSRRRVISHISSLGGQIESFFSSRVTHLITTRDINVYTRLAMELESNNLASEERMTKADVFYKAYVLNIKIWSLDKLIYKVLGNLLPSISSINLSHQEKPRKPENLSHLLYEEKWSGTKERDPKTLRSNYTIFQGPYILIRDIHGYFKTTVAKEYPKQYTVGQEGWPALRKTALGRCPFLNVIHNGCGLAPVDANLLMGSFQLGQDNANRTIKRLLDDSDTPDMEQHVAKKMAIFPLQEQSNTNTKDILPHASGLTPSNLTSAIRSLMPTSRIGKPVGLTRDAAKSISSIQYKLVEQRCPIKSFQSYKQPDDKLSNTSTKAQTQSGAAATHSKKEVQRNYYCENCKDKYSNLEAHLKQHSHQRFAENEANFLSIDEFIQKLTDSFRKFETPA